VGVNEYCDDDDNDGMLHYHDVYLKKKKIWKTFGENLNLKFSAFGSRFISSSIIIAFFWQSSESQN
jgi:uncharacterized membrane protein YfbV (UPF0208 family)